MKKKGAIGPGLLVALVLAVIVISFVMYLIFSRGKIAASTSSCIEVHNGVCIPKSATCGTYTGSEQHPQGSPYSCTDSNKKCCIKLG